MAMTAPQPPFVHYETPSTELLFAWCLCRAGTAHISSVGFMFLSRGEHHRAIWLVHLVAVTMDGYDCPILAFHMDCQVMRETITLAERGWQVVRFWVSMCTGVP